MDEYTKETEASTCVSRVNKILGLLKHEAERHTTHVLRTATSELVKQHV
jgi:hypothetical protein